MSIYLNVKSIKVSWEVVTFKTKEINSLSLDCFQLAQDLKGILFGSQEA
jgi:hypothetical protein